MTEATVRETPVGALRVAFLDEGAGEALVLVHGQESDKNQFELLRDPLGEGIRTIAYDQRDTGGTVNTDVPYDMGDLADDLVGLLDALGLERAHVLGTSFGGILALRTAIDHPQRVQSLSLIATSPSHGFRGEATVKFRTMHPAERPALMLDLLFTPAEVARNGAEHLASSLFTRRAVEMSVRRVAAVGDYDLVSQLDKIVAPTLVVHGTDDPLMRPEAATVMAAHISDARVEMIEHGRHAISVEFPNLVGAFVRQHVLNHPLGPAGP